MEKWSSCWKLASSDVLFSTALFYLLEVSKAGNCRRSLRHVRSNLSGNPLLFPALLKDSSKSSLCSHLRKHKQHNTVKIPQDWRLSLYIYPKVDKNSQRTPLKSLTGVTSPPQKELAKVCVSKPNVHVYVLLTKCYKVLCRKKTATKTKQTNKSHPQCDEYLLSV